MRHLLVIDLHGDLQLVDMEQQIRMPVGDPPSGRLRKLSGERPPTDAGSSQVVGAVWSEAGQWTAWSVASENPEGLRQLRLHDEDTDTDATLAEEVDAFCLSPSPCGRYLAHLSAGPLGLELAVSDTVTGDLQIIERGEPLYWSWAPDELRLAVHVGNRVSVNGIDGSQPHPLTHDASRFTTPLWLTGGSVIFAEGHRLVCADVEGHRTTLVDGGSTGRFLLDADGRRLAYLAKGEPANRLIVLDLVTGDEQVAMEGRIVSFCWSSQGRLALLMASSLTWARWVVWDDGTTVSLEPFRPGARWSQSILPFFEQFSLSNPFWSPDGRVLVASALNEDGDVGAVCQYADGSGRSVWIPEAELAWWA